jgi:hypothetical protein
MDGFLSDIYLKIQNRLLFLCSKPNALNLLPQISLKKNSEVVIIQFTLVVGLSINWSKKPLIFRNLLTR